MIRWDAIVIVLRIVAQVAQVPVLVGAWVIVSIHVKEHVLMLAPEGVQDTAIIHAAEDVEVRQDNTNANERASKSALVRSLYCLKHVRRQRRKREHPVWFLSR